MHPSGLKHTSMQTHTQVCQCIAGTFLFFALWMAHLCILEQNNMKTKHERVSRTPVEHVLGLKVARVAVQNKHGSFTHPNIICILLARHNQATESISTRLGLISRLTYIKALKYYHVCRLATLFVLPYKQLYSVGVHSWFIDAGVINLRDRNPGPHQTLRIKSS